MNTLLRRPSLALVAPLALFLGCTQDFAQFENTGAVSSTGAGTSTTSTSSVGSGGSGGAGDAASSSSSSASGSGGLGGSGGSLPEDCLDGSDNDKDGLTDCADPDCNAGFECTDPAPTGWEGYFRIHTAAYPNAAPSMCPDGASPQTYYDGPSAGDCSPCACGGWAGATCSLPTITCYEQSGTCGGNKPLDFNADLANGDCFAPPDIDNMTPRSCKFTVDAAAKDSGACPPSGGALVNGEPWANQDDVCGGLLQGGGGCTGKQVCIPKGGGDYNGPVCIRKMGTDVCPGDYSNLIEVATDGVDDRACAACACAVSGVSCMGSVYSFYNKDDCTEFETTVNSTTCADVSAALDNDTGSIKVTTLPQPAGGTCAPTGGTPMGSVTPEGVATFCCK